MADTFAAARRAVARRIRGLAPAGRSGRARAPSPPPAGRCPSGPTTARLTTARGAAPSSVRGHELVTYRWGHGDDTVLLRARLARARVAVRAARARTRARGVPRRVVRCAGPRRLARPAHRHPRLARRDRASCRRCTADSARSSATRSAVSPRSPRRATGSRRPRSRRSRARARPPRSSPSSATRWRSTSRTRDAFEAAFRRRIGERRGVARAPLRRDRASASRRHRPAHRPRRRRTASCRRSGRARLSEAHRERARLVTTTGFGHVAHPRVRPRARRRRRSRHRRARRRRPRARSHAAPLAMADRRATDAVARRVARPDRDAAHRARRRGFGTIGG